ncbi:MULTISPECIES: hypothetical protein [unclassified Paraflavitalea]|uniref:hypothetical protein n=1 Tax=unclassified Paraflavitalea TaxID=2798305 RepID=UPI003D328EA0
MSEGCPGCFGTQKQIQQVISSVVKEAQEYAYQNQKNVYIYKNEFQEIVFMEEAAARHIGIIPMQVVSYLRPINA